MKRAGLRVFVFLLVCQIAPASRAQERQLEVSGVFTMGYSKSRNSGATVTSELSGTRFENRTRDFGFGLDLNVGTYILDPRFIKLSFNGGFFRDKGGFDNQDTRYGNTNLGLYVDVLQTSNYPFRFHYAKQNSNYLQKELSSADSGRSNIGFDWALRSPRYPKVSLIFDSSRYDNRFLASSGFKSQIRTWNASLNDTLKGWDYNANYNDQSTIESLTNVKTNLRLLRFDARRKVFRDSDLFINVFQNDLTFSTAPTRLKQEFSFFNLQTSLTTKHTEKLSSRFAYQFYRSINDHKAMSIDAVRRDAPAALFSVSPGSGPLNVPSSTPFQDECLAWQRSEPEQVGRVFFEDQLRRLFERSWRTRSETQDGLAAKLASSDSASAAAVFAPLKARTSFGSLDGQVIYRLTREITVAGSVTARTVSPADRLIESATRFMELATTVSWSRRFGFVDTRASVVQGISRAQSNVGESRSVQFHEYSAGAGIGNARRALVSADFNLSSRPDIFQIGGFLSQKSFNAGVESQALRGLQLRASAGQSQVVYLTTRGREQLRTTTYLASLEHKVLTLLVNHNLNSGVRDAFLIPVPLDYTRIFRLLPVDTLIRDPRLNTSGIFTLGMLRVRPRHDIDVEARYLKDKALFARTNSVFTNQFDLLLTYRLGKFTFTGGALFQQQQTVGLMVRDRTFYYFRLSRPFKAL